jgi:acyl-CoA dehydrogenase family member 9
VKHAEAILDRQYVQERIAWSAIELYACACVVSRWDAELHEQRAADGHAQHHAAELFLRSSARRIHHHLAALKDNDDALMTYTADDALR